MDVTVSCRNTGLSLDQQAVVERKLAKLSRIVTGLERAVVHFSEERNPRIAARSVCEVTLEGHGHQVVARGSAADPVSAVDATVPKLEQQLQVLKSRLMTRYHGKGHHGEQA